MLGDLVGLGDGKIGAMVGSCLLGWALVFAMAKVVLMMVLGDDTFWVVGHGHILGGVLVDDDIDGGFGGDGW